MDIKKLIEMKVIKLREYARKYKIPKYSRMRQDELIEKIVEGHQESSKKVSKSKSEAISARVDHKQSKKEEVRIERREAETRLKMKEAMFSSDTASKQYFQPEVNKPQPDKKAYDRFATPEIPFEYNTDRITLLVIDPTFTYVYWEITDGKLNEGKNIAGWDSNLTLRVYDVTDIDFNGFNAHSFVDTEIYERIGCWYIRLDKANRNLVVDIGLKNSQGHFHSITRSNFAKLPPLHMAPEGPIKWMAVDDLGNYVITEVEEYTEADLILLRKILGEDLFRRFLTGEFKGMLFSTVFKKVPDLKEISLEFPSSPTSSFLPTSRFIET